MVLLQRQRVYMGVQQASQKGDKFSPEKPNHDDSLTKLDMGVLTMVVEW